MRMVFFETHGDDPHQFAVVAANVEGAYLGAGGVVRVRSVGDPAFPGIPVNGTLSEVVGKIAGVQQPGATCETCAFWRRHENANGKYGDCRIGTSAVADLDFPGTSDVDWCREHFAREATS